MSTDNDTPERDRQVVELLRAAAASERAPDALHARVAAMRDEAAAAPRRRLLGRGASGGNPGLPRPAFGFARVAVPAAAAAAAVVVLALGGGAGAPSIAQAAALATRAPTASPPATDPSDPGKLLAAEVGTLHFPNWQADGGWRAVGQRHDHLGNRTATTVYYAAGSRRLVYSIVSAPTLPGLHTRGEPYETIWRSGRATVVWQEAAHTCLLTGTGISPAHLWQLATLGFRKPLG